MNTANDTLRLDKFLANNGLASRRGIKKFLKENIVLVNGTRAKESGTRIKLTDKITINGEKIKDSSLVYYILNKPIGIISTSSDEYGRENVTDLIPSNQRIYPVGRLDKDTHGLILLTNDGELTHKATHPRFHVPKKYLLTISGNVSEEKLNKFKKGIILSDGITAPAKAEIIKNTETQTIIEMEIYEGRYRQIRRMCQAIFLDLVDLKRIQFGPIKIGNLREGQYRQLTKKEIEELKNSTKL